MKDLIMFKGNRAGLTVVLNQDEDFGCVLDSLAEKFQEADDFLEGSTVNVDIGNRNLQLQQLKDLESLFLNNKLRLGRILVRGAENRKKQILGWEVKSLEQEVVREKGTALTRSRNKRKHRSKARQLFKDEVAAVVEIPETENKVDKEAEKVENDDIPVIQYSPMRYERKDLVSQEQTILIQRTIRSGQRIFYPGNVVVLGDVNPGGEVIAGGNIIVMGTFRGVAHAGAAGEEGAIVAALRLEPSQLRIAGYITRAPEGDFSSPHQPEIARVQDGIVIIEQYQSGCDRNHSGYDKGGA